MALACVVYYKDIIVRAFKFDLRNLGLSRKQ